MSKNLEQITNKNKKLKTAFLSIIVTACLIVLKFVFGFLTNSISIIASAVDSLLDLSASSINYFSIKKALKPADEEHRFGHGKAEGLAGLFQSSVIGLSAFYLVYISVIRLIEGTKLDSLDLGIVVIALSVVVSFFLSRYITRVAEETDSIVLKADSLHYRSDVYTNTGIITGLIAIRITGLLVIDSIVSLGVALYIIWSSVSVFKEALDILMDRELPKETVSKIEDIIHSYKPPVKSFHKMRTRRSGDRRFIDFHLVMDNKLSFIESHSVAEEIIKEIEDTIPHSDVTVHVDPHKVPDYS